LVMCVRKVQGGKFVTDVGKTAYLEVPTGQAISPTQDTPVDSWVKDVLAAAEWKNAKGEARGDILFVVHGYNMSEAEVLQRHRRLAADLLALGFRGVVVSFDWPSDDKALAYLPDRHRAKATAMQLVSDGIMQLSRIQTPSCPINIHVLGHSTGAYVIREAFDDADDTAMPNSAWNVSQAVFAAGDVSASSMSDGDPGAESVYRHCVRLTNYSNRHDEALDISNVKRLGIEPRVGRIGLPKDAPSTSINVDCTAYYEKLTDPHGGINQDQPFGFVGMQSHSWYFGNAMFTRDLFNVLIGTDRTVIQTREQAADGSFNLRHV
jgi:hypothetical protein